MTHEPRNSNDLTGAGAKHFKVAAGSFRRPVKPTTVTQTPLEEDHKLAKAIARTKLGYQTHLDKKHAKSIKVIGIHEIPEATTSGSTATKVTTGKCQAVTLTGKPCPWAKFGGTNHCKKHQVNVAAMENL